MYVCNLKSGGAIYTKSEVEEKRSNTDTHSATEKWSTFKTCDSTFEENYEYGEGMDNDLNTNQIRCTIRCFSCHGSFLQNLVTGLAYSVLVVYSIVAVRKVFLQHAFLFLGPLLLVIGACACSLLWNELFVESIYCQLLVCREPQYGLPIASGVLFALAIGLHVLLVCFHSATDEPTIEINVSDEVSPFAQF